VQGHLGVLLPTSSCSYWIHEHVNPTFPPDLHLGRRHCRPPFVLAGTIAWPEVWIFLAIIVGGGAGRGSVVRASRSWSLEAAKEQEWRRDELPQRERLSERLAGLMFSHQCNGGQRSRLRHEVGFRLPTSLASGWHPKRSCRERLDQRFQKGGPVSWLASRWSLAKARASHNSPKNKE
jgi:hypothetical protein